MLEKLQDVANRYEELCFRSEQADFYNDPKKAAALLREKTVSIHRGDARLEDGAVFVDDLIGLTVTDQDGRVLGKVTEVISMPKNDVYVVQGETQYMIPAVAEFVRRIDPEAGEMEVFTIEGMQTHAD